MASASVPEVNDDFLLEVMKKNLSLIKREVKLRERGPRTKLPELVRIRLGTNRRFIADKFCNFLKEVCFQF